jgi:hypothetical protein
MIKKGEFCGGPPPYGYKLVKSGNVNKKGKETKKLAIDEKESEVVKLVFKLATQEGMGGQRISVYLNERGIPTRRTGKWGLTTVNYMLRHPIYKGFPVYGKTSAETGTTRRRNPKDWLVSEVKINELVIIDETTWDKAQAIRHSRTPACYNPENLERGKYPMQTKSPLLFIGFIKCGHCGSTMCSFASVSKWKSKGEVRREIKPTYRCTATNRGIPCDGQNTYVSSRIELPVLDEIHQYLDNLERVNYAAKINEIKKANTRKEELELREIEKKIATANADIEKLNNEITKSLSGESEFTPTQLSAAIAQKNKITDECKQRRTELLTFYDQRISEVEKFLTLQTTVPDWREEFERASTEAKKMMLSELLHEIVVFKNRIIVNFKVDFNEFVAMERGGS